MKIDKHLKALVCEKTNYRCCFCGDTLVAHVHTVLVQETRLEVDVNGQLTEVGNDYNNLYACCKECGSVISKWKGKMTIENFRDEIIKMYQFARDYAMYSSSIRRAIKFGLISETHIPIKFYFETNN